MDRGRRASDRQKGGLAPPLHADGDEGPLLDQLGQTLRSGRAKAEIVPQVLRGRHAERACRDAQQLTVRIRFAGGRRIEHLAGQYAFGEVVDALEIASTALRRDHARPEQPFERSLRVAPAPPGAAAAFAAQVARGAGTALFQFAEQRLDRVRVVPAETGEALVDPLATLRPRHAPAQQRLDFAADQGSLVAPILEQLATLARRLQPRRIIGSQTGVARHEVRASEHVDRVDLNEAKALHDPVEIRTRRFIRPGTAEALRCQRDAASLRCSQLMAGQRLGFGDSG